MSRETHIFTWFVTADPQKRLKKNVIYLEGPIYRHNTSVPGSGMEGEREGVVTKVDKRGEACVWVFHPFVSSTVETISEDTPTTTDLHLHQSLRRTTLWGVRPRLPVSHLSKQNQTGGIKDGLLPG